LKENPDGEVRKLLAAGIVENPIPWTRPIRKKVTKTRADDNFCCINLL
jgi:hypothetical protein